MSIGFGHSRDRRKRELTNNRNIKGIFHVRICLRDIFGFAEHQETATFGLGYNLTLTRNTDNAVLNEDNATNNAKIKIIALEWYVPHFTPSLENYNEIINQITKKTPTNLHYPERSVFKKEVNTQIFWTFELGVQGGINVPKRIYVVFQQNDRQHDQKLNNVTFYRMPVTSVQCIIGSENYPDSVVSPIYNDDDYILVKHTDKLKKLLKL